MFSQVGCRLISGVALKLRFAGSRGFTSNHARMLRDGGWGMSTLLGQDKTTDKSVLPDDKSFRSAGNTLGPVDNTVRSADKTLRPAGNTLHPSGNNVRPADSTVRPADNTVRPADFLTEQEFTAYTRLFSDMDKNKDGAISKEELKDGLRDFIGYEASESELSESMLVLDKNKDGKVDINDFLQHMQARKSETRLEAIRFTFEMWDSDSDGFIDKNDLRSMLRAVGEEPSDEKINKILNTSDLDKDGKLSFQEFKDIFKDKQF